MRKRESFLIIRRVGVDCQADRREDCIIHHREREYLLFEMDCFGYKGQCMPGLSLPSLSFEKGILYTQHGMVSKISH
jgi:hypothetical protein